MFGALVTPSSGRRHQVCLARLLGWLAVALVVLVLTGCAGRIVPPEPRSFEQPVDIFLLDHGRHASLVLPRQSGGVVRYSYGDWRWYVEGRQHALSGAAAMLWPTDAGIGRAVHPDIATPEQFHRLAPEGLTAVYPLEADMGRVLALKRRLDAHFERADMEPVPSEQYGRGFGGQGLYVIPSRALTIAITADPAPSSDGFRFRQELLHGLVERLLREA